MGVQNCVDVVEKGGGVGSQFAVAVAVTVAVAGETGRRTRASISGVSCRNKPSEQASNMSSLEAAELLHC